MITKPMMIKGSTTGHIVRELLRPGMGWEDQRDNPPLLIVVTMDIPFTNPDGSVELLRGTMNIPTSLDEVSGMPYGLGIESGSAMTPVEDRFAAAVEFDTDDSVKIADGKPVIAKTEHPSTSHWCVARLIPRRSGACLVIEDAIITPKRVPEGQLKDQLVLTKDGAQCVTVKGTWSTTIKGNAAACGDQIPAAAEKGARRAQWRIDEDA